MTEQELYKKYAHIIPGSIELVLKGTEIQTGKNQKIISHGRICVIRCEFADTAPDCQKTRIINTQDARQTTKCSACTRRERNIRRRKSGSAKK